MLLALTRYGYGIAPYPYFRLDYLKSMPLLARKTEAPSMAPSAKLASGAVKAASNAVIIHLLLCRRVLTQRFAVRRSNKKAAVF